MTLFKTDRGIPAEFPSVCGASNENQEGDTEISFTVTVDVPLSGKNSISFFFGGRFLF